MSLIAEIPLIGPTIAVVLPFLLVLAIVVFIHEYGHYIVGRWCGIGAEAFSIGFGREIWGWTDSRGTRWKVSALPLGGYVKFLGDSDAASAGADSASLKGMTPDERSRAFPLASVERRAATVFAGPAANFLLSIVIFAAMAMVAGAPSDEPVIGDLGEDLNPAFVETVRPGDRIVSVGGEPVEDFTGLHAALAASDGRDVGVVIARGGREIEQTVAFRPAARIDDVRGGSAADAAGLEPGDVVVAVEDEPISSFSELQEATRRSGGAPMTLTVERGEERRIVEIDPEMMEVPDPLTGEIEERPVLGIVKRSTELIPEVESVGPFAALGHGAERTWRVVDLTVAGVSDVIAGRQQAGDVLGGPVRIAEISGEAASTGLATFVGLIAVLSTSIGLINLLPIPVLDGGHLMFYAVEKLRGRPLRERWQEIGNGIGLALVLSLMIFATFNDLARL